MASLDRDAARRATAATAVALAVLVASQSVVAAAVTGGRQPVAQSERIPQAATDDRWERASARTVSLSKQQMAPPFGGGSVGEVRVRALTNDSHVGFRLTWTDPTNDTSLRAPGNYSDAAAIMARTGSQPPITMGATGQPVDIWYWRSQWQYGASRSGEWTGDMYSYPHPDNETRPGRLAGNPLSRARYEDYGQNYYAAGFGSLSHADAQNVRARATRSGDEWSVAFVREHATDGEYDATFGADEPVYLAFAVWNGSADEVNGKKSISLQFSKLTTDGALAAADGGGSGNAGAQGPGSDDSGSGGSDGQPLFVVTLLAVLAVTWAAFYWRAAR